MEDSNGSSMFHPTGCPDFNGYYTYPPPRSSSPDPASHSSSCSPPPPTPSSLYLSCASPYSTLSSQRSLLQRQQQQQGQLHGHPGGGGCSRGGGSGCYCKVFVGILGLLLIAWGIAVPLYFIRKLTFYLCFSIGSASVGLEWGILSVHFCPSFITLIFLRSARTQTRAPLSGLIETTFELEAVYSDSLSTGYLRLDELSVGVSDSHLDIDKLLMK